MADVPTIRIQRLPHAEGLELPAYASAGAAGADLRAAVLDPMMIAPGERAAVPTGLVLEIPDGWEGQIRPRSGLAIRYGLTVVNPVRLDGTYRITNPHNDTIELKRWDSNRIAAHHYFGVESQIQDLAMRFVADLDSTIWLHDGFMTNHEIDTQKLELLIKKELKVKVRYKQTKRNQLVLATG